MNYLNSYQISKKWNISQCRIIKLAREGRISGAKRLGRNWMIPENAKKPIDGRTRQSKNNINDHTTFRYPCYAFRDESDISPKLSKEELIIKKVQEQFYACNFEEARKILDTLSDKNEYCYIYGLYANCMIDMCKVNTEAFVFDYQKLYSKLIEDNSKYKELQFLIHEIDAILGNDQYFNSNFLLKNNNEYDISFLPHLTALNTVALFNQKNKTDLSTIKAIELTCRFIEESGNITDLQATYFYLGNTFFILKKYDEMKYYYTKALDMAQKYNLYFDICSEYYYLSDAIDSILNYYPIEFVKKIKKISNILHNNYNKLTEELSLNSIYRLLPGDYYPLLFYAVQGYANKEIANMLNVSEPTINKKFGEMYDLANVNNKNGLIELYKETLDLSMLKKNNNK